MGLDTISAGACMGLAMQAYEQGWLTEEDADGVELTWGSGRALVEMARQLGEERGIGPLFAGGALEAARHIHPDAVDQVVQVRGLDLPAHDARACWTLAINYATSTRGACHMRGVTEDVEMGGLFLPEYGVDTDTTQFFQPEGKAKVTAVLQDVSAFWNSAVICTFMLDGGGLANADLLAMINAITGWGWELEDLRRAGERIFTLQRLINIRDGKGPEHDIIPLKMTQPAKEGFRAGQNPGPHFERMLAEYYGERGWEGGVPSETSLRELGLSQYGRFLP